MKRLTFIVSISFLAGFLLAYSALLTAEAIAEATKPRIEMQLNP